IDAYVGGGFEDIAVDELRLSDGECNNTEIHNGNCSFEGNLCGWTHDPTAQFSWTLQSGETSTFDTGPTTGADNSFAYIFIESSLPQALCDRAGLMSPLILRPTTTSGAQCFSFFYHMHGIGIGSLLIWTIENTTASAKETLIWQQNGAQGNEWLIERINLWPTEDYYFRIDGYVGDSFQGDIAVDEITLLDGECTEVQPYLTPRRRRKPHLLSVQPYLSLRRRRAHHLLSVQPYLSSRRRRQVAALLLHHR
ncbi:unnamed protein product, partial [Didymodactylos carnosus]